MLPVTIKLYAARSQAPRVPIAFAELIWLSIVKSRLAKEQVPRVTPPTRLPITLPFLKAEISKRAKKKGLKADIYDRAYLPDFTARALGLKAETITVKQANKKLKKLLTGLEIRRGVKIK